MFIELFENQTNFKRAIIGSWIVFILSLLAIGVNGYAYTFVQKIIGGEVSSEDIQSFQAMFGWYAIIFFLVYAVSSIFFLIWLNTIYKNLGRAGGHQSYREFWTSLAWFVPIMNLFVPYQIMQETYKIMQYIRETSAYVRPLSALGWWWFLHLVGGVLANFSLRDNTLESVSFGITVNLVGLCLLSIGHWLAIGIVKEMSAEETRLDEYVTKMMESTQDLNPDSPTEEGQGSIWA